jgi:hypothetical protein
MSAQPDAPWRKNPYDLRSMASTAARYAHFDNPLLFGALSAGLGYMGGKLLSPLARRLYPEFDDGNLPLAAAVAVGAAGGGLSWLNSNPRDEVLANMNPRARDLLFKKGSAFSAPINPILMHEALRPMMQQGFVSPAAGTAMSALTRSAAGPGGQATVQSYASTARQAMNAVGRYFDPRARVGWALAGAGAALVTNAVGLGPAARRMLGRPVGEAVTRYGPGLQLMATGLALAGGR